MALHLELSRRTLVLLMVAILLCGGLGLAVIFLPHADITVSPAREHRSTTQEITLATDVSAPDFVRFVLPAKIVEAEIEDTKTITRQSDSTTEDTAKGVVTLHNEQDEEQPLLPKSHLRHETSGVEFLTDNAVRIPPQGTLDVPVTAKVAGSGGNVPPGRFIVDKLPDSLKPFVYGESSATFSGGLVTDTEVSESEITEAKAEISNTVTERAISELTLAAGGAHINPELVLIETITDESSASPGSKAVAFEVRQKIRARAFIVDDNDLLSLTLLALRSSATDKEEFVEYDPNSFTAAITKADFERGQARVTGTLTGTFASTIEPSVLSRESVAGLGKQEAIEYFTNFPAIGEAIVEFSPFWVRSVPTRASAVTITVK